MQLSLSMTACNQGDSRSSKFCPAVSNISHSYLRRSSSYASAAAAACSLSSSHARSAFSAAARSALFGMDLQGVGARRGHALVFVNPAAGQAPRFEGTITYPLDAGAARCAGATSEGALHMKNTSTGSRRTCERDIHNHDLHQ